MPPRFHPPAMRRLAFTHQPCRLDIHGHGFSYWHKFDSPIFFSLAFDSVFATFLLAFEASTCHKNGRLRDLSSAFVFFFSL
jgi:hypothetical protein